MQRLINFLIRNKATLLFLFLLFIALSFTIRSHSYHHAVYLNSSNWLSGTIFNTSADVGNYFDLREENNRLQEENRRLRTLLFNEEDSQQIDLDTTAISYSVERAEIIKNSYASSRNYLTINKGKRDSIFQDMGVINSEGVIGIVEKTSNGFAMVQSILNENSTINAKIKNTDFFGSLTWNGRDHQIVQLEDIPRAVPVAEGDTIVTGAMSSIFPENIPIGTVRSFKLLESSSFFEIEVTLFNDMTNLDHVYLIRNKDREEILELENEVANDQ